MAKQKPAEAEPNPAQQFAHKHTMVTRSGGSVVIDASGIDVQADTVASAATHESFEDEAHVKKS